jgi:enoyl-CoA hydratase/carnithine racemase
VEACLTALLEAGPRATRLQKKLIRRWEDLPVSDAITAGIDAFADAYSTEEPARLMRAFLDRPRN